MRPRWFAYLPVAAVILVAAAENSPRGQELFEKRCAGCHSADRDLEGPHLRGVYGRRAGTAPRFPYSDSLRAATIQWDEQSLDRWLTDPEAFVPGNDMAFRVEKAEERAEIIRYLRHMSAEAK